MANKDEEVLHEAAGFSLVKTGEGTFEYRGPNKVYWHVEERDDGSYHWHLDMHDDRGTASDFDAAMEAAKRAFESHLFGGEGELTR